MKKQILFYCIWDIVFLIYMLIFNKINAWIQEFIIKSPGIYPLLLLQLVSQIVVGGFLFWLMHESNKFQHNKKYAVMELLIIGGLGLYLSAVLIISAAVLNITGGNAPIILSVWGQNNNASIAGGIVLGYELCTFISRINSQESKIS